VTLTGTGPGTGNSFYNVTANTGPSRTAIITVAGQTITLTQQAGTSGPIKPGPPGQTKIIR